MNENIIDIFTEFPKIKQILPHQIAILDYIIKHVYETSNGILLYAKPGTGKTLIGIICSQVMSNFKKLLLLMPSENIVSLWRQNIGLALTLIDNNYNMSNIELISMYNFISNITNNGVLIDMQVEKYRDNIIIIDEAHNILNNTQYTILLELKKKANNTLILLTGSPINNTVETLPNLLRLLVDDTLIDENIITTNTKVFEIKFKEDKEDYIKSLCKNNISYYEIPKKLLPKINYVGEKCGLTFNCIVCPMTEEHYKIYKNAKQYTKNEIFEKILMNVSLYGIDNVYVTDDLNRLQIKEYRKGLSYNGSYFFGNEFNKLDYAPKIKKLLEYILYEGKHFIYFSNASFGSLILHSIMKHVGYVEFGLNKTFQWTNKSICYKCGKERKCKECIVATYIILTGQNINQINGLLKEYNKEKNKEGQIIKIIFGSNVLSEAYTLKETLHTHYLTVPDNYTQIEQINGRTIRKFAFKEAVTSNIYLYLTVEPNYKKSKVAQYNTYDEFINNIEDIISYDLKKLLYIDLKNHETDKILTLFKDCSVSYRSTCHKLLNIIMILNKLRELFYKETRIDLKSIITIYDKNIFDINKSEFLNIVFNIIENHPFVINKYFKQCLLYNIKNEVITIPYFCDYGVIYSSFYMKKEIAKVDITKKKNDIYILVDRGISINYKNSLMNIKSLTFDLLSEICDKLKIELENKKYFKDDLIELIIKKLKKLEKENPNILYIIKNQ